MQALLSEGNKMMAKQAKLEGIVKKLRAKEKEDTANIESLEAQILELENNVELSLESIGQHEASQVHL